MNLIDLPDLMRQRSDEPTPTLTESRLEGVHHKVVIARRRRVAGGLVAVAAVVVAALGVGLPSTHHDAKLPATEQKIDGFPAYADGGHVVGTANGNLHDGPVTVTVIPERLDFLYTSRCSGVDPMTDVLIETSVNGHDFGAISCGTSNSSPYGLPDPALWATFGLAVGEPATFTFTATKATVQTMKANGSSVQTAVPMPAGTLAVAVLQKLPFDRYPLPPRPKKLPAIDVRSDFDLDVSAPRIIDSDPTDPLKPVSYTFTFPSCDRTAAGMCLEASMASQTPGSLAISVNGTLIHTAEIWDYSGGGYSFEVDPTMNSISLHTGEKVTITITPQYVTGAWQFGISTVPLTK